MKNILYEITPLTKDKVFFSKFTPNDPMVFPIHFHEDYEITLVNNTKGRRIVGNNVTKIDGDDLVLITPNTIHGYKWDDNVAGADVAVLQFSRHSVSYQIFSKDVLKPIGDMLARCQMVRTFSQETIKKVKADLIRLPKLKDIDSMLLFIKILYELSIAQDYTEISAFDDRNSKHENTFNSRRINSVIQYVEKNYMKPITLEQIASMVNMSPSAFSRFFKRKTNIKFWDFLNNYRIDAVAHMMVNSDAYISEISYKCGFNNISNFNRAFKRRMGSTPKEYRERLKDSVIPYEEKS